jgi:hypothetical protein
MAAPDGSVGDDPGRYGLSGIPPFALVSLANIHGGGQAEFGVDHEDEEPGDEPGFDF